MLPFGLPAQTTFVKEYATPLKDIGREIHIINDSTFILECHREDEYILQPESTYLIEIDLYGNINRHSSLPVNINDIFPKPSGGYLFTGDSFDGEMIIGKLTDSLTIDTLISFEFGNLEYYSIDAFMSDSGFIITTGKLQLGLSSQTILHKISQNLDTIKTKVLDIMHSGAYATVEESFRIIHENDSSIYLIGANAYIVKLNSNLDTLISFRNENHSIPSMINYDICLKDDTLLVLSDGSIGLGYVISKVTEDLVFQSSFYNNLYPYWESMSYRMVNVNNYYFLAGYLKTGSDNFKRQISLIKLNENFDTVWIRKFGGQYNEKAYDLILTSDSCLMMIGETQTATYYNAFDVMLVKTDLNGQIIGGTGFIPDRKVIVNAFPNPVEEVLTLSFVNENRLSGLQFQLFDLTGKLIKNESLIDFQNNYKIDLSTITSGLYLYRLVDEKGVFFSERIVLQ